MRPTCVQSAAGISTDGAQGIAVGDVEGYVAGWNSGILTVGSAGIPIAGFTEVFPAEIDGEFGRSWPGFEWELRPKSWSFRGRVLHSFWAIEALGFFVV
ncbi:unnamed protein product [Prunus armeniaca]|uniref:Uncharacterized protein n=1 Tax=Prunus armeniaca TaxID=36596 RepID=A0A6J5XJD1_PRUAR|nr:unnamed protein product [Prunus armeniaca]CAB4313819.1 unnamed protein product [Prunus armeniaca]